MTRCVDVTVYEKFPIHIVCSGFLFDDLFLREMGGRDCLKFELNVNILIMEFTFSFLQLQIECNAQPLPGIGNFLRTGREL